MKGNGFEGLEAFDDELAVFELPVLGHFLELFDDAVVHKVGSGEVHGDLWVGGEGSQFAPKSEPIGEDDGFLNFDDGVAGGFVDGGLMPKEVGEGDLADEHVKEDFHDDASGDTDEEVGGEGGEDGGDENGELASTDLEHLFEFFG